jgi:hypothetical protein
MLISGFVMCFNCERANLVNFVRCKKLKYELFMKIEVGDKVRFLNVTGGGQVTRLEGKLAFVEDEDGFEVPVLCSELVVVQPSEEDNDEKEKNEVATNAERDEFVQEESYEFEEELADDTDPKFYLAFLAGDKPGVQSGSVRMQLVNDSNYFCFYTIHELGGNEQAICLHHGQLEPNTKLSLGKQLMTELDDKTWEIQLLLFKKQKRFIPYPAVRNVQKLKAGKLFRDSSFAENDYFHEKAILIPIIKGKLEKSLDKLSDFVKEKEQVREKKSVKVKTKRKDTPEVLEVDLHIHELLDDTRGLSNSEILGIQLDKFRQVMKENEKNTKRKIVFIHGVGNGTLKIELRKELDRKFKNHVYQDASFREYGYGATLVII